MAVQNKYWKLKRINSNNYDMKQFLFRLIVTQDISSFHTKTRKFTPGWLTAWVLFAFPIIPVALWYFESSQYVKFCLARRPYSFQRLWYNLCAAQWPVRFDYTAYCIGQHLIRLGDLTLNQVKRTRFMFSINKLDSLVWSQSSKTNRFTKQKNLQNKLILKLV